MNKHIITFNAGYDCITFECKHGSANCLPGGGGSHGRHGLEIRFVSKGEKGAVQFLLYTGWLPKRITPSRIGFRDCAWGRGDVTPADLGYHSKMPRYDGQSVMQESCEYCDGQPCYYDGSALNANDAMYALVNGGLKGAWKFLDEYYSCVFEDQPYPMPAEYPASLRSLEEGK